MWIPLRRDDLTVTKYAAIVWLDYSIVFVVLYDELILNMKTVFLQIDTLHMLTCSKHSRLLYAESVRLWPLCQPEGLHHLK